MDDLFFSKSTETHHTVFTLYCYRLYVFLMIGKFKGGERSDTDDYFVKECRMNKMIVKVFIILDFDDDLTIHEIEDIVNRGEYFPWNVIDCDIVISNDQHVISHEPIILN